MSTVTDNDLKELKDLINNRFDEIKQEFNGIDKRLTVIETRMDEWRPSISKISDLADVKADIRNIDKRLDEFNSRFNIMTLGFLSIIGVLVTGVLGAIAKLVFFPNP